MVDLKKRVKKILAISLAALVLGGSAVTVLPEVAQSGIVANAYTGEENGFQYLDTGEEIWITKYVSFKTDVVIPSTINGKPVTQISNHVFYGTNIKSVVIPDSVKEIGPYAFQRCEELKSVDLGNGVEEISMGAFMYCSALTEITIPYSVKKIINGAFSECSSLKKAIIPDTVEDIMSGAFYHCDECTIYGKTGSAAESYVFTSPYYDGVDFVAVEFPTAVKLNKSNITLNSGKTEQLSATVSPSNSIDKNVKWSTSNSSIAVVSNGKVTAKNAGTAIITAKTGNGKKATCTVTVKKPIVAAKSVKLSKTSVTLGKGKSTTIKATVNPSNTTNKKVTWTTSNKNVATVSNGKITAKGIGTATITVTTANGKKATCKVTVRNLPTNVKLNRTSATLGKGKSTTLKATVTPSKNVISTVTWSTSNSKVATVKNGKITAKGVGTATITVKTTNGKKATCKVTVRNLPTKVKLNRTSATLGKGKSTTLKATVTPSKNVISTVTWSTSNSKVATVKNGKITAKGVGTATITVKTTNGKKATCKVTVKNLPTRVKLNKTSVTLKKGKSTTLKATVTPSKNVINTVTWSTSNSKVATVKNGKVTAKAKGTATITVKTTNGKKATCKIKVK